MTVYVPGLPLTLMLDVVEEPLSPDGRDQEYEVALLTPVTDTDAEPADSQNATELMLPPDGVATIVTVPVTGIPEHVIPEAMS